MTIDQLKYALQASGMDLESWDGVGNPVALRPHPLQPWTQQRVTVSLASIANWLALDSGEFDPIAMGM